MNIFMRLNLTQKMLIGYAILIITSIFLFIYAEVSFRQFRKLNNSIVTIDITIQKATNRMHDALMDQNNYEKRYLILRSNDMIDLFWKRGKEFHQWLNVLKDLRNSKGLMIEEVQELQEVSTIDRLYKEYEEIVTRETDLVKTGKMKKAYLISNVELKRLVDKIASSLGKMSANAKNYEELKMGLISVIGPSVLLRTIILWIISITVGVLIGSLVTYHITSSIHKLIVVTEHIAEGDFDYEPKIRTSDEIGSLSKAFVSMGKRLKVLEGMYLDASPLTHLAGGLAIENILKKRLDSGEIFAFFLLDIDNFKAFNDQYGYARGNIVLKETAKIIEQAVRAKGGPGDFVGHIGGDDFVVITIPERIHEIGNEIIKQFDARMPDFYDPRDRENGYIIGKNRQGVEIKFPIITFSIAVVTNERRRLTDPMEVSEIAAELKDYAKTFQKSNYVIDKRVKV
ncbi:MAG: diguanylate cyclase [Deltaproteobacteria bacterium]|nr:diguanylate cyclase [Deltaproteobacteria bacterium]